MKTEVFMTRSDGCCESNNSLAEDTQVFIHSIDEQIKTLSNLSFSFLRSQEEQQKITDAILLCEQASEVIVTGVGKSGHIGCKIAATLASTHTKAHFVHATEASHGDMGMIPETAVVLAISNSGETSELTDVILHCQKENIPIISITGTADNTLADASTVAFATGALKETACHIGKAPMNSTTATLVLADALATTLMKRADITEKDFGKYHPGGKLGAQTAPVKKWMATADRLPAVSVETTLDDAYDVLGDKNLGCVIVVNKGKPVGIITDGMLRKLQKERKLINMDALVTEYMKPEPIVIAENTLVDEAKSILTEKSINHLPVVDEQGALTGVFTFHTTPQV